LDYIVLSHILSMQGGLVVHAAGMIWGGKGILLPGRSGTGKSTFMRNLQKAPGGCGLSDDRIVVRRTGPRRVMIAGTPWLGDAGVCLNKAASLDRIVFLVQARRQKVRRVSPRECLGRLIETLSVPWYDKLAVMHSLPLCEFIVSRVPALELQCAKLVDMPRTMAKILGA